MSLVIMMLSSVGLGALFLIHEWISAGSTHQANKLSSFECGFSSLSSTRVPFSTKFFSVVILFVLFDVEIALLFPLILTLSIGLSLTSVVSFASVLIILVLGLAWEVSQGMVSWSCFVGSLMKALNC
nr:NADH dehydrogenase subunit 3 [Physella acuta]CAH2593479.1 NADH dehydrogenase subunit 3 [Physella acuta]CAH2593667.1 NADH dehydrogenase subunit 3 [Physella acuta]CAH2593726.1 NADH dehydrogenase subunit 3 [Physella acuta]CAH2594066.1 NADH dehydrogenase subunit 3 [Physella acuta]